MENEITLESQETAVEQENNLEEREEKTFTQEEVNKIIQKRLREKKENQQTAQELEARASELSKRENKLECKEYLIEKGYPKELLDIIAVTDFKEFKSKADTAYNLIAANKGNNFVAPLASLDNCKNPITTEFANTKHEPRKYGYPS